MWNWFRAPPCCPLDAVDKEMVETRLQRLAEALGLKRLREAEVVLPTPTYFPDPYQGEPDDVRRLLDRVCGYLRIDPTLIDMEIYQETLPQGEYYEAGMETGCMFEKVGARFKLWIEAPQCHEPLNLVALMARELALVDLIGLKQLPLATKDQEPLAELYTVLLGLGVFTANAAIYEKYWHESDGRGDYKLEYRGALTLAQYGYALALFAWLRGESKPAWARELRRDVRTAFTQGLRYIQEDAYALPPSFRSFVQPRGSGTS